MESFESSPSIDAVLNHDSPRVRLDLVKELGRRVDENYSKLYIKIALQDKSTVVRREAVSSLGRLRNKKYIPTFFEILHDSDPKVVLQAVRALLVFKTEPEVRVKLRALKDHRNEMVRDVINKEFNQVKSKTTQSTHPTSPEALHNLVVHADVLDLMKHIDDDSIHLTFTSPPYYNARDYSIYESYEDYLKFLATTFKEVHRITKEGRFLIVNTSPIIVPRVSRQHSSKRYPIPFDLHAILVNDGWEYIDDIIWLKPEASVKNRVGGFMQHRKPLGYKPNTVTEMLMVYRKKTDKLLDWNIRSYDEETVRKSKVLGDYESTNVWKIDPAYSRNHTAIFPLALCDKVIAYYSYVGDLVFDPFAGSGTLGVSAMNNNRKFLLAEKSGDYFEYMKKRFSHNQTSIDNSFAIKCVDLTYFKKDQT
jgi:DNA modification methylase